MKTAASSRLAGALRVLVILTLICNLLCLLLVPGVAGLLSDGGPDMVRRALGAALSLPGYEGQGFQSLPMYFAGSLWGVWTDGAAAFITAFLWLCGICTALILWQAKLVLDTILKGDPFRMTNANALRRAAVCCWVISGAALVRLILRLWAEGNPAPLFTYNALFVPGFFMAGLLFLVMSALFRQAAALQEDQNLTI